MTQFAQAGANTLPLLPDISHLFDDKFPINPISDGGTVVLQQQVDALIEQQRASIPDTIRQINLERRKRERLKISRINQLNNDGIQRGLKPVDEFDDRGSVMRFLDLVDLPRNVIFNIAAGHVTGKGFFSGLAETSIAGGIVGGVFGGGLFSGLTAPTGALIGAGAFIIGAGVAALARAFGGVDLIKNKAALRKGALGLPTIFGSDILASLGVENKIIRAIVGFAGDVLLDPLTYLSGGGNIITVIGKDGLKMRVSAAMVKLWDDTAEHVRITGKVPDTPIGNQLRPFFEEVDDIGNFIGPQLIKTGELTYAEISTGPGRLKKILSTDSKLQQDKLKLRKEIAGGSPVRVFDLTKQQRKLLAGGGELDRRINNSATNSLQRSLRAEIGYFASVDVPIGSMAFNKAAAARKILREYGAKSSMQFTFPLAGWVSNRLRLQLGGRSGSFDIGRLGQPAQIQKALGESEQAFLKKSKDDTVARLLELRKQRTNLLGPITYVKDGIHGRETLKAVDIQSVDKREALIADGWRMEGTLEDPLRVKELERAIAQDDLDTKLKRIIELRDKTGEQEKKLSSLRDEQEEFQTLAEDSIFGTSKTLKAIDDELTIVGTAYAGDIDELATLLSPRTIDGLEALDGVIGATARGDIITAHNGMVGRWKWLWKGHTQLEELQNQGAKIQRQANEVARVLRISRTKYQKDLLKLDNMGTGAHVGAGNQIRVTSHNLADHYATLEEHMADLVQAKHAIEEAKVKVAQNLEQRKALQKIIDDVDVDVELKIDAQIALDEIPTTIDVEIPLPQIDGPLIDLFRFPAEPAQFPIRKGTAEASAIDPLHPSEVRAIGEIDAVDVPPTHTKITQPIIDTVDINFQSEIDRLIYEAGGGAANNIIKARRKASKQYLKQAMGISGRAVGRLRKQMFENIQKQIQEGRAIGGGETTAGAAAGGGQRTLEFPTSEIAFATENQKVQISMAAPKPEKRTGISFLTNEGKEAISGGTGFLFEGPEISRQTTKDLQRFDRMQGHTSDQFQQTTHDYHQAVDLEKDITDVRSLIEGADQGRDIKLQALKDEVTKIQDRTMYGFASRLVKLKLAPRDLLRIGSTGKSAANAARLLRIQHEVIIPNAQRQTFELFEGFQKKIQADLGADVDMDHISAVIFDKIFERTEKLKGKLQGFATDDPINIRIQAIKDNPKYAGENGTNLLYDHPEIDRVATAFYELNEEFRFQMSEIGLLPDIPPKWFYMPIDITKESAEVIGTFRREIDPLAQGSIGRSKVAAKQGHQLHRASNRLPVIDPVTRLPKYDDQGNLLYIWEGQLTPGGTRLFSNDQVQLGGDHWWEAQRRAYLEANPDERLSGDLWDLSKGQFGSLTGERWIPEAIPSSPWLLNAKKSEITGRIGANHNTDLVFETDVVRLMVARTGEHHRALANATFKEMIGDQITVMSKADLNLLPAGRTPGTKLLTSANGNKTEVRQLNKDLIRKAAIKLPIDEFPEQAGLTQLWPEDLATQFEDFARVYTEDEALKSVLKAHDQIITGWKVLVLANPRWLTINMIGGGILSLMAGGNPANWPKIWKEHGRTLAKVYGLGSGGTAEFSTSKVFTINNVVWTEQQLIREAIRQGVVNGGRTFQEILPSMAMVQGELKGFHRLLAGRGLLSKSIGYWFRVNAMADDMWRYTTWLEALQRGESMTEATNRTIKYLFDYGDLTKFEHNVGRRSWPFYRWMRNNIALQVHTSLKRPAYAAAYPKILNALQEQVDDEDQLPTALRPRWMRDRLAIQLPRLFEKDPRQYRHLIFSSLTPAQELFETGQALMGGEGFSNFIQNMASGTNPIVKSFYEIGAMISIFDRRKLGPIEENGIPLDDHLFRQTGLIYEVFDDNGSFFKLIANMFKEKDEKDTLGTAIRVLIGGRFNRVNIESLLASKRFELGESTLALRFAIKRELAGGNIEEAERLAIKFVAQNRLVYDTGMKEAVPKFLQRVFRREDLDRAREGPQ